MRASIVICCYSMERIADVLAAVASVQRQSTPPHEVIVAVDHNPALAEELAVRLSDGAIVLLNNGIRGVSETRNLGLRSATGNVVVYIDDDAVAEYSWLEHLIQPFDDPTIAVVGGSAVPRWHTGSRPRWFAEELDWVVGCTFKGMPTDGGFVRNPIGCSMAFRREVFDLAGEWDTGIGGDGQANKDGEETELSLRIMSRVPGSRIYHAHESGVFHKVPGWRATPSWVVRRSIAMGQSKAKVQRAARSFGAEAPLSRENAYLRYLLTVALPARLRHAYRPTAILQAGTLLLSMATLAFGYARELRARA